MEHRAGINRFEIFLLCLLIPLGSLAPTETSRESKTTAGQKNFTDDIKTSASVIEKRANELFEFYTNCVSETFHEESWKSSHRTRDMANTISACSAFRADCCALRCIHGILKSLGSAIETFCNNSKEVVEANIIQLNTTLSQGASFYTCSIQNLPQGCPQGQPTGDADRKIYIWWVLKTYKDIMQKTKKLL